ncbi:MAG: ABC transporter substrate-binding protein [Spirochaetales bacterium]|nr:ABC transporter substrate-binding protein [Spirochaetales bacterium]
MNRNVKGLVVLLALSLLAMPLFAGGKQEVNNDESDTIHIALTAPLSGDYAEYGTNFQRSVEMGIEFINKAGGVLGKDLVLSVGDSKGDPKESATLAQKWTSDPTIVAEIGDFTSTCCMASQPIYDQSEMVQLSPTASHSDFAPGSDWSFGIVGTQAGEGPFMADFAYNGLGLRTIAVININNDWGIDTQKYFSEAFEKLGGVIIATESYFDGEKDFTAILTKMKATKPDALFMAAMYNDGALISKQRVKLGWDVVVVGPSSLYSEQLLTLGGDAVEGLYTNVSFFTEDPAEDVQFYVTEFESRYGVKPNFHAALAFDAINILAAAIEKAGTTDRTAIKEALAKTTDFKALTGSITFTPVGDAVKQYTKVWITDGKFKVYND